MDDAGRMMRKVYIDQPLPPFPLQLYRLKSSEGQPRPPHIDEERDDDDTQVPPPPPPPGLPAPSTTQQEQEGALVLEPLVRLAEHDDLVSTLARDFSGNLLATGSWDRL